MFETAKMVNVPASIKREFTKIGDVVKCNHPCRNVIGEYVHSPAVFGDKGVERVCIANGAPVRMINEKTGVLEKVSTDNACVCSWATMEIEKRQALQLQRLATN